jgi:hypothetical protein
MQAPGRAGAFCYHINENFSSLELQNREQSRLETLPSGRVVLHNRTTESTLLSNVASLRFAPLRSASVRLASLKSAFLRFAPLKLAPLRLVRLRSAPLRLALLKRAPSRLEPYRLTPFRLHCSHFFVVRNCRINSGVWAWVEVAHIQGIRRNRGVRSLSFINWQLMLLVKVPYTRLVLWDRLRMNRPFP